MNMYKLIEELHDYVQVEDGYVIKLNETYILNTITKTLYIVGFDTVILDAEYVKRLVEYFERLWA